MPGDAGYWWAHLCGHLADAGTGELDRLLGDLRWVQARLVRFGPLAVDADLAACTDAAVVVLRRAVRQNAHLLRPTDPEHSFADALIMRLAPYPELALAVEAFRATLAPGVRLSARWALPDRPHPAVKHVLAGHAGRVS
ncbi:hypothetical protein [Myceligenerans indicum]|uniref:hypothetical protein n=1 Tax=Myceligenerans indicum TaxID=2593663 RepID=UPI00191D9897|nr:hypothetical protein [Myceligenerans indicum]